MPLSNVAVPKIDQYAARRILANRIMNNVVQSLIWGDNMGITERFSDNVMGAQVRIIRQLMPVQRSRTLGTGQGFNDSHFNVLNPEQPITQEYELPLIEMFDRNVDIADVLDDMIQIGTLNITIETLEKRLAQIVNAYTAAVKVAAALNFDAAQGGGELIVFNPLTDAFVDKIAEAHAKLDEGSPANGVDTFPQENRIVVTNVKGKYQLLTVEKAVYQVGSSRAVELIEIGSAGTLQRAPETNVRGYFGQLYNTELYMASKPIFTLAEEYLGLHAGALDNLYAIVSASSATGRGVAFMNSIKIIDNPRGQGVRLQPKTRWGAENWFPEGERLIVRLGFHNPVLGDEVEALVVRGLDNNDPLDLPDFSTFFFDFDIGKFSFVADATGDGAGTVVPFKLGVAKEGADGYSNVRVNLTLVEGTGDLKVWWDFAEEGSGKVDVLDAGYLGLEGGQPIDEKGAPYTTAVPLNIVATATGVYSVKVELVDVDDDFKVLATNIVSFYVKPA